MEKLVSIIIPTYNNERYISKTLNSLINQSFKKLEIIIVDDGSNDNTRSIVKEYLKEDRRIKYYYQKNSGAPAARNYGFEKSNGEYIIYFDSDDEMLPDGVKDLYECSSLKDYDITIGNFYHHKNGYNVRHKQNDYFLSSIIDSSNSRTCNEESLYYLSPVPCNKLFKKSYLVKNYIYFNDLKIGQDLNFYLKALSYEPSVGVIAKDVFRKNDVTDSITSSYNKNILDILNVFNGIKFKNHTIKNNLKFIHYNHQLAKVPLIRKADERKDIYNSLKKEISKINKTTIDFELVNVNINKMNFAMKNGSVFTSEYYRFFNRIKSNLTYKIFKLKRIFYR